MSCRFRCRHFYQVYWRTKFCTGGRLDIYTSTQKIFCGDRMILLHREIPSWSSSRVTLSERNRKACRADLASSCGPQKSCSPPTCPLSAETHSLLCLSSASAHPSYEPSFDEADSHLRHSAERVQSSCVPFWAHISSFALLFRPRGRR